MARIFSTRNRVVFDQASVRTVDDKSLLDLLVTSNVPVLVDFYADWCEPCRFQSAALDLFASSMGEKVEVVKIEIEKYPQIGISFEIQNLPTLILFVDGQPVETLIGARDDKMLKKDLSKFLVK